MFLKGCLGTVLETSGSLNAEITVVVFYASVVPSHKDFHKPGLGRKRWGGGQAYRTAAFTVLPPPSPISNSRMSGHWPVPSGVGWEHLMALTLKQLLNV